MKEKGSEEKRPNRLLTFAGSFTTVYRSLDVGERRVYTNEGEKPARFERRWGDW